MSRFNNKKIQVGDKVIRINSDFSSYRMQIGTTWIVSAINFMSIEPTLSFDGVTFNGNKFFLRNFQLVEDE